MYLGYLYNNMNAESPIQIYAVNITDIEFPTNEAVENIEERKKFKLMDGTEVLQSDDILFLASYLRLFNFFYCNSLNKNK
jgi:DNA integrity scanning protein DisA with diadenylate cyclase activity